MGLIKNRDRGNITVNTAGRRINNEIEFMTAKSISKALTLPV
jgi:hypothetical protein